MLAVVFFSSFASWENKDAMWLSTACNLNVTSIHWENKETRIIFVCASSICDSKTKSHVCCAFAMGLECTHFCLFAGISEQPWWVGCIPCDHLCVHLCHCVGVKCEKGDSSSHGSIMSMIHVMSLQKRAKVVFHITVIRWHSSECLCASVMMGSKVIRHLHRCIYT